jgi:hypothetical protein
MDNKLRLKIFRQRITAARDRGKNIPVFIVVDVVVGRTVGEQVEAGALLSGKQPTSQGRAIDRGKFWRQPVVAAASTV